MIGLFQKLLPIRQNFLYTLPNNQSVNSCALENNESREFEQNFEKLCPELNKVKICTEGPTYGEYLKLERLLSSQQLLSERAGNLVPDEHLFIITHQVYELWFKQILFDIDHVINIFSAPELDETRQLRIVNLLDRIVKIMKLLIDQILVLETMPPLEFVEFRRYLSPASGFQSMQFRLLENKLGLKKENRVPYNSNCYKDVFRCPYAQKELDDVEKGESLFSLLEKWLERTPGLNKNEFNFWEKYSRSVDSFLDDQRSQAQVVESSHERSVLLDDVNKLKQSFDSILDQEIHRKLVERGDRRLSHRAMQGALMLSFYRDMPRFSQPYQMLVLLMDIDSLLTKWRHLLSGLLPFIPDNHVMLVQRMLGSKSGTGGSSGYMYLRSTVSDRYKIFLDLFNLSNWLIPKNYIPRMSKSVCHDLCRPMRIEEYPQDLCRVAQLKR